MFLYPIANIPRQLRGVILTLLLSGSSLVCTSSNALTQGQIDQISKFLEEFYIAEELVGLQAAIYSNNGIAASMSLGYADLEHGVSVSSDTRFEVASINKVFTALGLLMLEEAGGIDLDVAIQSYVSDFPEKPEGVITARQLAGILGGIRHYEEGERTAEYYSTHYSDVDDALSLFRDDPLVSVPGEREAYSSYGYVLLAAAMQAATGVKFEDHIRQTILEPLNLDNTGFIDIRIPMQNRSRLYSYIDPYTRELMDELHVLPSMEHSAITGGGNMYSTAENLATFGSEFIHSEFLSERIYRQMYQPHYTSSGTPTRFSDGWLIIDITETEKMLIGGGSYPGVTAMLIVNPAKDAVVSLLTNTWGKQGNTVLDQLVGGVAGILYSE